jgi:hypothetical protein
MTAHGFQASLAMSRRHEDAGWWLDVYRAAWPTMLAAVSVREDGWSQRAGIDRVVTLACGRVIRVDEKVRAKDYPDILLEIWSDRERREPGWACKPLNCDFIAYAFAPSGECYLFPTLNLQIAVRANIKAWLSAYGFRDAKNSGPRGSWTTQSIPVPKATLLNAISASMLVRFAPSHAPTAPLRPQPIPADGMPF